MHGVPLPGGMRESERLPEPVFTPSTKAETGHDENITVDEAAALVGADVIKRAAEIASPSTSEERRWPPSGASSSPTPSSSSASSTAS